MFRRIGKVALYAIGGKDFASVLKRLGIYQEVAGGRTHCRFCGGFTVAENLGGGQVRTVCSGVKHINETTWSAAKRHI